MKTIQYQQKAVKQLVESVIDLLDESGQRKKLVFKAPTGAGKTVMASEMLRELNEQLAADPKAPVSEVAYIWIAPNKLHEQSYFKMKNVFTETRELKPVIYDEIDHSVDGYIRPGEILFVNWESINKDNAIMTRDTEQQASLYNITDRTQTEHGIPIIVIIDEEHMFGGRAAKKSEKVLESIAPKIEIRISATPLPESKSKANKFVEVPREKVIAEQMIKEGVTLNPALEFNENLGSLNQHLIHLAVKKREELAAAYKALGVNINPLLLIQLPNDGDNMNDDDNRVKEEVLQYLSAIKDISVENGKLAIWLSNEKTDNLRTVAEPDDITEVLLFKQAIALGWDCPRAAVLLIFRKIESVTFSAQTVGRILRMPEQRYYSDARLNRGYVYTNLSKDIIEIVKDDMDYLSSLCAKRRDDIVNVQLCSVYSERPATIRNRIGPDFKDTLTAVMEELWHVNGKCERPQIFSSKDFGEEETGEGDEMQATTIRNREVVMDKITFSVRNLVDNVVENVDVTGEVGIIQVEQKAKYARTGNELEAIYMGYCAKMLRGEWEKACIRILGNALLGVMEKLFEVDENEAMKVILYNKNIDRFTEVIDRALRRYAKKLAERQAKSNDKSYKDYTWEVPAERFYNEQSHHEDPNVENHALVPFVELNNASNPEQRFTAFLEQHKDAIDWWYKNGDSGKQHYAVQYETAEGKALFYVDFIIRMKNGQILLFDTKSAGSDGNAPAKHNALIDYMASEANKAKNLSGGVVIEHNGLWYYSPMKITTTDSVDGWSVFHPDDYKA